MRASPTLPLESAGLSYVVGTEPGAWTSGLGGVKAEPVPGNAESVGGMDYRFLLISRAVSIFVALSGLLVMVGWIFSLRSLTTLYGSVPIGVGTALATLLAGSILAIRSSGPPTARQSFVFRMCGGLLLVWGVLSLLCHFLPEHFGAGMGVDLPSELALPGPATSITFAVFGLAMLIFDRISLTWLGEALASLVGLVGLLAFTGYLYGVPVFYQLGAYRVMPFPIAVNFCLLSLAYMLSRTNVGFGAIVFSKTIAGAVARRLLPAAILIPVPLGWLHLLAEKFNLFSADFGTALVVLAFIVFFTITTGSRRTSWLTWKRLTNRPKQSRRACRHCAPMPPKSCSIPQKRRNCCKRSQGYSSSDWTPLSRESGHWITQGQSSSCRPAPDSTPIGTGRTVVFQSDNTKLARSLRNGGRS